MACMAILGRLKKWPRLNWGLLRADVELNDGMVWVNGVVTDMSWGRLVLAAFVRRVSLSSMPTNATPGIHFDPTKEKDIHLLIMCMARPSLWLHWTSCEAGIR